MTEVIGAKKYVENALWLPEEIRDYMIRSSVAVNRLTTVFPEDEIIRLLQKYSIRISHIVVAYEVPPDFTRKGQYDSPDGYRLDWQEGDSTDLFTPGFYSLSREYDESVKIVLFMRENILSIVRERNQSHLKGAYNQYLRLRAMMREDEQKYLHPLSLVGILPGRIISSGAGVFGDEYKELIKMAEVSNRNSARFVTEALYRIMREHGFSERDVIILGSEGELGKEIGKSYAGANHFDRKIHPKDSLQTLLSTSKIILDCTNGEGLSEYLEAGFFSKDKRYIWIVESYPVPRKETVVKIAEGGFDIRVIHIKGVGTGPGGEMKPGYGNIIPFPVYGHIMPCCTATVNEPSDFVVTGDLYSQKKLG